MALESAKQITALIDATRLKVRDRLLFPDYETLTAAGAVSVILPVTLLDTTAGAMAITLANAEEGQVKIIYMQTDNGAATLTPVNLSNGTTVTFDDVNDAWVGIFLGGSWRSIVATATVA